MSVMLNSFISTPHHTTLSLSLPLTLALTHSTGKLEEALSQVFSSFLKLTLWEEKLEIRALPVKKKSVRERGGKRRKMRNYVSLSSLAVGIIILLLFSWHPSLSLSDKNVEKEGGSLQFFHFKTFLECSPARLVKNEVGISDEAVVKLKFWIPRRTVVPLD